MTESSVTAATLDGAPPPAPARHWPLPGQHPLVIVFIVLVGIAAVLAVLRAWELPPFSSGVQVTDNAYLRGRTTIIAPQVSGYVVAVETKDFASVQAGQVLVRIDERQYRAKVDQARAALQAQQAALANLDQAHASRVAALQAQAAAILNAKAQLQRAAADLERVDDLVADGSVSVRERDQMLAALAQSQAQLDQSLAAHEIARQDIRTVEVSRNGVKAQIDAAAAQLRAAEIDLENTVVRAPESGQLGEVGVRLGQYVTNGTQLLPLVPGDRWVIANYKETQTAGMHPGMSAWITVDALGGQRFDGRIEEVAPAAGSEFSVVKPDNGTGNFVKIPQRIGVRVRLEVAQEQLRSLRPGMSVEVHVDVRNAR
jgi:multidrug resistance efflux pump